MIFVTVGNATQGFERLLQAVDVLAGDGAFGADPVFLQSGHTPSFTARHCEGRSFISMDEFEHRMRDARLIISHGGNTVLAAIRLGKMPVVMPRMKKYREVVNDHQVQFVRALAEAGRVIPAYEAGDLRAAVLEALTGPRRPVPLPSSRMPELVARAIIELSTASGDRVDEPRRSAEDRRHADG